MLMHLSFGVIRTAKNQFILFNINKLNKGGNAHFMRDVRTC